MSYARIEVSMEKACSGWRPGLYQKIWKSCSDVPNKGEQMVRYYGDYSNVSRGKRKKQDQDGLIPSILEPVEDPDFSGKGSSREHRRNWARLIQKIYEIDPLTCPKCKGRMCIIAFIDDADVVKKILKDLGLWVQKARSPPKANSPQTASEYYIDYSTSQLPEFTHRLSGGSDMWLYVDPEYPEGYTG
jgi:hypothetical protein